MQVRFECQYVVLQLRTWRCDLVKFLFICQPFVNLPQCCSQLVLAEGALLARLLLDHNALKLRHGTFWNANLARRFQKPYLGKASDPGSGMHILAAYAHSLVKGLY